MNTEANPVNYHMNERQILIRKYKKDTFKKQTKTKVKQVGRYLNLVKVKQ